MDLSLAKQSSFASVIPERGSECELGQTGPYSELARANRKSLWLVPRRGTTVVKIAEAPL